MIGIGNRCIFYINTDKFVNLKASQTFRQKLKPRHKSLTGERCTLFILENYSSTLPSSEKTYSSFDDPNEGQNAKSECGPMDEWVMLVVEDCEERPRDRDRSGEVAFRSGERVCRRSGFEEES